MTDYKKVVKQRFCDLFCSYLSKYHRSFSYKPEKKAIFATLKKRI